MASINEREHPAVESQSELISLAGKVALVTGSSRDFGAGIARELAREGATVIGNYRDKARRALDVQSQIEEEGGIINFVKADIKNGSEREKLLVASKESGGLDFLVLNAAGADRELNVDGNNALVDDLLPVMRSGGKIIFIQSSPGHFYDLLPDGTIPSDYIPVAESKYEAEQSLISRSIEFNEKGISLSVVVLPEILGTWNITIFRRRDQDFTTKLEGIAEDYGHTRLKISIEDGAREVVKEIKSPNNQNSTIII